MIEIYENWASKINTSGEVPPGLKGACAQSSGNKLYLFGGYGENGLSNTLY